MKIGSYTPVMFCATDRRVAVVCRHGSLDLPQFYVLLYRTVRRPTVWNSIDAYVVHGPYPCLFEAAEDAQALVGAML